MLTIMLERSGIVNMLALVEDDACNLLGVGAECKHVDSKEQACMTEEPAGKAKGGFARAEALPADRRSEIAKKAADARWGRDLPKATHEGDVTIGDVVLPAAVLDDGRRVLSQGQFLQAIGRSRSPKGGTGALATVDELPFSLQADVLKPFIPRT
jgi:hypothetical protein